MKYHFDEVINRKGTYSSQWDFNEERFGSDKIIPFSISDMDFKVPKEITKVLQQCVEHQIYGYTRWNHDDFKNAIVSFYRRRHQITLEKEAIVYSPTVMYSISVLFNILSKPDDKIVTFNPMYDAFFKVIENNNRVLLKSDLINIDGHFEIDVDDIEQKLSQATIFLLCSPHNPTGRMWKKEELDMLIEICKKYQVAIISDEIHSDIILTTVPYTSILDYQDTYSNIYMVSSSSKIMNTPGLIGSYAYISNPIVKDKFNLRVKDRDFVGSASLLGMQATMIGYTKCDDYIDALLPYIKKNMEVVKEFIDKEFTDIHFIMPEATYLAWIDMRQAPFSMEQIQDALIRVGKVGMMSGSLYGDARYIRMNVGCPTSKVEAGLLGLKKAMDYLYNNTILNRETYEKG